MNTKNLKADLGNEDLNQLDGYEAIQRQLDDMRTKSTTEEKRVRILNYEDYEAIEDKLGYNRN
jgi:hypothetical protein